MQQRLHLPAGLVHMRQRTAPRRIPQRMPCGFRFARHPLDGPANPAPAHDQSKALPQNGGGIGMRQALQLVHQHSQAHRLRPYLYRRRSDRIGGLEWMPPLHPRSTLPASADGNVKPPYPRPAHDLFLILRLDPLQRQGAGARRTLRRNRYWNLLIHTLGHGPTAMSSVAGARLAAWRLRMTLALAS